MAAGENRFAPELNEKEVIELLEDLSNILGAFLITKLVGYEMIKANTALRASSIIYHLISNALSRIIVILWQYFIVNF